MNNLHPNEVNKNNFWKTLGPFFSNKSIKQARKIILLEKNEIVSDDREIVEVFMKYFSTITESIDIPKYDPIDKEYLSIMDPVFRAIGKYKDHPSIARINSLNKNNREFNFKHFCPWEIKEKVTSLKNKSSSLQMLVSILKNSVDVCLIPLTDQLNNIVNDCHWPIELGSANITPANKKESTTGKGNYRPISVLPPVSKVFEKLFGNEVLDYIKDKFSPLLCGFRKQFSMQHALVRLTERWKHYLDKSGAIVGVLMDLSKAYDCISYDLLIAKLHAYGLGITAIRLLHSYLTNRKQRTKINNSFSEWVEILIGIPQGSVLGPLLFNIFINDLLLGIEDGNLCNFADDNTLYKCCETLNKAKFLIESQCSLIIDWFEDNFMKMNPETCQVIILGQKAIPENFSVEIDNILRKPVPEVTLLEVTLDNKLKFNSHTSKHL